MKQYIKSFLLIAAVCCISISCKKHWTQYSHKVEIHATIDYYCSADKDNITLHSEQGDCFSLKIPYLPYASIEDAILNNTPVRYNALKAKYGDNPATPRVFMVSNQFTVREVIYNEEGKYWDDTIARPQNICIIDDIEKIDILAVSNWNENYTRGSSLAEIFTVEYGSFAPYFANNCTGEPISTISRNVAEITPENPITCLANSTLSFCTDTPPTDPAPKIAITIRYNDGSVVERQITLGK